MKSKKRVKKLQFNKQSIAKLNVEETEFVYGGVDITNSGCSGITCFPCDTKWSCLPDYCRWCYSEFPGCID